MQPHATADCTFTLVLPAQCCLQVGVTPSFTELPRDHCERMRAFKDADKPLSLCPPEKDPKMRFFWRLGERPAVTDFPELNAAPVTPEGFPEWTTVCCGSLPRPACPPAILASCSSLQTRACLFACRAGHEHVGQQSYRYQ
ncbi:MAG: hypothetical protein EOO65_05710 [Methanosarcinales archaeon]|nr:MAG: hypothetical protein EOO65_05710 [Methanosarcinales archaeon]